MHTRFSWIILIGLLGALLLAPAASAAPTTTVQPQAGPPGTRFLFFTDGFAADEPISIWLNAPEWPGDRGRRSRAWEQQRHGRRHLDMDCPGRCAAGNLADGRPRSPQRQRAGHSVHDRAGRADRHRARPAVQRGSGRWRAWNAVPLLRHRLRGARVRVCLGERAGRRTENPLADRATHRRPERPRRWQLDIAHRCRAGQPTKL